MMLICQANHFLEEMFPGEISALLHGYDWLPNALLQLPSPRMYLDIQRFAALFLKAA